MSKFTLSSNLTNNASSTIGTGAAAVCNISIINSSNLDFVLNLTVGDGQTIESATIIPAGGVYERGGVVVNNLYNYIVATCTTTLSPTATVIGVMTVYGYAD